MRRKRNLARVEKFFKNALIFDRVRVLRTKVTII